MRGGWPRKRRKSLDPGCFAQYTERKAKGGNGDETWRGTIWQDRKRVLGMPLTFTKYFLSEDRLFLQTGVLNMKMEEVLLYRVSDIGVHVSLGQRIFGVGTIIIHSSDKSAPHLELKNVKNPLVVKELIHKHVESMKTERGVRVSEFLDDGPKRHDPCTPPPKMEH